MKKRWRKWLAALSILVLAAGFALLSAGEEAASTSRETADGAQENATEETDEPNLEEQGLSELRPLMEASEIQDNMEGKDLEQITDTLMGAAMSEYINAVTGLSFQYPAQLLFDPQSGGMMAVSEDEKTRMMVESIEKDNQLTLDMICAALQLEDPETLMTRFDENGSALFERTGEDRIYRADVYYPTDQWLHHISVTCPETEGDQWRIWLQYMIHSLTSTDGNLG